MPLNIDPGVEKTLTTNAATRFGIAPDTLTHLGGNASSVYGGELDGRKVALKITPASYRPVNMVESEIEFVDYLYDQGVPTPRSIPSTSDLAVEQLEADNIPYVARVEQWLHGRLVEPHEWTPNLFRDWGALTGKMHVAAKNFRPKTPGFYRQDWQEEMREDFEATPDNMPEIKQIGMAAIERLDEYGKPPESFGMVHGDMHQWNMHWDGLTLYPLDFDNTAWDYYLTDHSVIIQNVFNAQQYTHARGDHDSWTAGTPMDRTDFAHYFMRHFMAGYRSENPHNEADVAMLPDLIRRRHLSSFLDRIIDEKQLAQTDEEQAAVAPYLSIAAHQHELENDTWLEGREEAIISA